MASWITKMVLVRGAPSAHLACLPRALTTSSIPNAENKVTKQGAADSQTLPLPATSSVPVRLPGEHNLDSNDTLPTPDELKPSGEVLIYEGPERDLINYPRMTMALYGGRTRLGFIPEEWFDFFYKKTGVTGPYIFGAFGITTLLSKEFWVVEHEFPIIPPLALIIYLAMTKAGPAIAKAMDKEIDADEEKLVQIQEGSIDNIKEIIKDEEKSQWMAKGQSMLFEAKRENVRMQLEAEYRKRLSEVYKEVKKRLDYQVEIQNTRRRVEQRHMINWIVNNVVKSIDEKQEKQNIDQCIANLQKLSSSMAK